MNQVQLFSDFHFTHAKDNVKSMLPRNSIFLQTPDKPANQENIFDVISHVITFLTLVLKLRQRIITKYHISMNNGDLFVCFCCFTSQVNSYGHCGTVSSPKHTFSWAGLNKLLTSNLCTYFRL